MSATVSLWYPAKDFVSPNIIRWISVQTESFIKRVLIRTLNVFLKKKMSFSFIELVTKEKKDLWQQDERYRIIGHIRCRPKNLAIHLNGNTESFVENCSMSSCCQIKWKFYSRKPLAKYQLNKRKYFGFCIQYHLQFRKRTTNINIFFYSL